MKNKILFIGMFLCFAFAHGQELKLSLKDAIQIAVTKSNLAVLADAKVTTTQLESDVVKNNLYPSLKISGQYLRLANANVDSNLGSANPDSEAKPLEASQLILGQANVSMPIFSGFKLKNSIAASQNLYQSEVYNAAHKKEKIALQVVELFARLYQAEEMVLLFKENEGSAKQRVADFQALMDNGLLARNDFLKAKLQESNVQISLEEAKKNANVINYKLTTLLQLPENTKIVIDIEAIKTEMMQNSLVKTSGNRNDLEALAMQEQASQKNIKIAKANYYPSISLVGGYIAFDLKDILTVSNAMNFGVGVSYDLASIFKNPKQVKLAKNQAEEIAISKKVLSVKIKEEIQEADENYTLSKKQSSTYILAKEQGEENFRIVKDKYDNSLSDTNDLLEADVQQLQSKINVALSEADIALKYYQLQFAKGNLLNAFNLSK